MDIPKRDVEYYVCSLAKKVLKEEFTKRIESGSSSAQLYLINEKYLQYFTNDELIVN